MDLLEITRLQSGIEEVAEEEEEQGSPIGVVVDVEGRNSWCCILD
jgi:hypothetical protein